MDTSPEYINMCRKATELQEMGEPKEGDFYIRDGYPIGAYCVEYFRYHVTEDEDEWKIKVTWLPRIDQCIDMDCSQDTDFFIDCIKMEDRLEPHASAEMKGLAVVMKTMYKKYWNGEDWTCTSNTTA